MRLTSEAQFANKIIVHLHTDAHSHTPTHTHTHTPTSVHKHNHTIIHPHTNTHLYTQYTISLIFSLPHIPSHRHPYPSKPTLPHTPTPTHLHANTHSITWGMYNIACMHIKYPWYTWDMDVLYNCVAYVGLCLRVFFLRIGDRCKGVVTAWRLMRRRIQNSNESRRHLPSFTTTTEDQKKTQRDTHTHTDTQTLN